ncbi:MAG TPA: uroporphyrinogen decarboxylase family protein [Ignavibacteria bacterium]|jgi:hypothetical protein
MSYNDGWNALNLKMPARIPHTEYISHRQFILEVTGFDIENIDEVDKAKSMLALKLNYDFIWSTFSRDWKLPRTDMGRAKFTETEVPWESFYPFNSVDEVLSFNPLESASIPSMDELVDEVKTYYSKGLKMYPDAVFPGGFYNSVFTWNIVTFGWELFMLAAKDNMKKFEKILDQFTEITLLVATAHIKANVPVYLFHDDIVWASGPAFSPEWMKKYIFPRQKKIVDLLKSNNILVLFCADGNFDVFIDDLIEIGFDGFIFEPLTNLELLAKKCGKTHVLMGNIDSRILQSGSEIDIKNEVKRCADIGKNLPGYFFAVGNHIPYTVPIQSVHHYLKYIEEFGKRY